jgi:hypothetical protein
MAIMVWNNYNSSEGTYVYDNGDGCNDTLYLFDTGKYRRISRDSRFNEFVITYGEWSYSGQHIWMSNWVKGCFDTSKITPSSGSAGFATDRDFLWRVDRIKIDPDRPMSYRKVFK